MDAQAIAQAVTVQEADFDAGFELARLRGAGDVGAVASFIGAVRGDGAVTGLELEHYPGMTEASIAAIIEEAARRWPLLAVRVIHRVGRLALGEQIVFVGVASGHRDAAFAACEFLMDYLKTRAPLWKKERTASGGRWVEARASDADAADRWRQA